MKIIKKFKECMQDERGSLQNAAWVLGSAAVVVAAITAVLQIAPDTAERLFNNMVSFIQDEIGF